MNFHEYLLMTEISNILELGVIDVHALIEAFQQPQMEPKNHGQEVQHMQQWWSNWTDPRGKLEKAKRLVQEILNKVGRDGTRGNKGENLVPILTDIRNRLIGLYRAMPDPMDKAHRLPISTAPA